MEYKKITENDLVGKGVVGQPDTPALSALEMQSKVEEVVRDVVIPHFNSLVEALTENGKPVQSGDVMQMRIGENGDLQISADGVQWLNVADKALEGKADKDNSYTKDQLYTKEETDTKLNKKAEADKVYTKEETDKAIGDKMTEIGAGDMQKDVYDTDGDGTVDNAKKLDGHEADYFSTFRDCSNVPFNEIASGKGAFLVNWSSANAADGQVMLGISDGWSAMAMSYSGVIYNTAIDKTKWEAVSVSKKGGDFAGDVAVTGLLNILGSSWNALQFKTTDNKSRGSVMISNNNRIHFNQGETGATYQERYQLPAITSGMTADKWYDIMTSRGGEFIGKVSINYGNHADSSLYNMDVWESNGSTRVATQRIKFCRK